MLTSTLLAERYEIGPLLGRSALSTVWRARDRATGMPVALKAVRPLSWVSPLEAEQRCRHIARALEPFLGLRAPHLAAVHEVFANDGVLYIARDMVDGCSLADLMANCYRLDPLQVDHVAGTVAESLQSLSRAGLVHGALKPANIFVADDGTVRLTDPAFAEAAGRVRMAGADCRLVTERGIARDLEDLAFLAFVAAAGYCPPELQPALRARYAGRAARAPQPAHVVEWARGRRPADVLAALRSLARPDLFQVAWRPAAAVGLFGVLLTMGGTAFTENAVPRSQPARRPPTAAARAAEAPRLSDEDAAMVRLAIRRQGPAALSHPYVADLLGLSEAQRDQIAGCLEEQRSRVAAIVTAAADGTLRDTRQSMLTLREATKARVAAVLTPTQQTLWQELSGTALQPDEPVL